MGREAQEPVERESGGFRERAFEPRAADLFAAGHVAAAADHVAAFAEFGEHRADGGEIVGKVGHDDEHRLAVRFAKTGADRADDAATGGVLDLADLERLVRGDLPEHRERGVLVHVVDDQELEVAARGGRDLLAHRGDGALDVRRLVVDRADDGEGGRAQIETPASARTGASVSSAMAPRTSSASARS